MLYGKTITQRAGHFAGDEDGSFVVFGLYLFVIMLLVGGVGVDMIRHDYERLHMQATVDNAILAAADLDQRLDPESVVRDHFVKAGMSDRLDSIVVTENVNSRIVQATASVDVDTLFLGSVGIDRIGAGASGIAREDIREIEVSMVLDISGSMGDENRITYLKAAAKEFVTSVLAGRDRGRNGEVSISLIPYQTEVAVGRSMLDSFALDRTHDRSACIDLKATDFNGIAMDLATPRYQTSHFDPFSNGFSYEKRAPDPLNLPCRVDTGSSILYMSQDEAALHGRIDALVPGGNTSIDVGLKWGAALLDPSMRPPLAALISDGEVDAAFTGRPFDHGRPDAMKIIVVMTDGVNTSQYRLRDAYAGDTLSDVWAAEISNASDPSENGLRLSIHDPEYYDRDGDGLIGEPWWIPARGRWFPTPYGREAARRLSYGELWEVASLGWHAYWGRYRQYENSATYYDWKQDIVTTVGASVKNPRMEAMCRLAKESGILIFSVAMDIEEIHATRMRDCASSENHYFNVTGTEIQYAFSAIASTINQLRLVQ